MDERYSEHAQKFFHDPIDIFNEKGSARIERIISVAAYTMLHVGIVAGVR
jgi:hypothetical protein